MACIETHSNAQAFKLLKRKMSDPDIHHPPSEQHSPSTVALRSAAISIPYKAEEIASSSSNGDFNGKEYF